MNYQQTNLVYPLNLRSSAYSEAFHSLPPSKLNIVLNPLAIVALPNAETERKLDYCRALFLDLSATLAFLIFKNQDVLVPSGSEMSHSCVAIGSMSLSLMELVTQEMRGISVDGVYPNVSICKSTMKDDPIAEHQAAIGMLCLDHWISTTSSTNPNSHGPVDVSEQCRQAYEKQIADNFTKGYGLCCDSLVYLRSACQVILRAFLLGEDPEQALDVFVKSNTKDFFAYMRLQGN